MATETKEEKFQVGDRPRALKSWEAHARREITRYLETDDVTTIIGNCMKDESLGPFTKFLYWFGLNCETGWDVMIGFNEYSQRLFLCDHYYKWMHRLRDEIQGIEPKPEEKYIGNIKIIGTGALFSEDRKYRHMLMRMWDFDKPKVAFIGLNPSTANETETDPTITNAIKIAHNNDYGGLYMLNLFSLISSNPKALDNHHEVFGYVFDEYVKECKDVVFAWGNFKQARQRDFIFINRYPQALCIVHNKNGSPKHPLYCKSNSKLIPFKR